MTTPTRTTRIQVNGTWHLFEVDPRTTLLSLLRDRLRLTGSKNGCSTGHCGACTVIVAGRAERACRYVARRADGLAVLTIEGLATGDVLHPLQRAFIEHGAVQCGFCTPGMIMAAKALLDRVPDPTDAQIKVALKHNLCRCTGYVQGFRAIRAATGVHITRLPAGQVKVTRKT